MGEVRLDRGDVLHDPQAQSAFLLRQTSGLQLVANLVEQAREVRGADSPPACRSFLPVDVFRTWPGC